jgi:multiple sugar transport system substrate-binding protein
MDDQEKRAGLLSGGQVSRRDVLKAGLIGAAGLTVLPTILAACGGNSATAAPVAITLGSNYSDPVPKMAMADMAAAFTAKTGTPVTIRP